MASDKRTSLDSSLFTLHSELLLPPLAGYTADRELDVRRYFEPQILTLPRRFCFRLKLTISRQNAQDAKLSQDCKRLHDGETGGLERAFRQPRQWRSTRSQPQHGGHAVAVPLAEKELRYR